MHDLGNKFKQTTSTATWTMSDYLKNRGKLKERNNGEQQAPDNRSTILHNNQRRGISSLLELSE